MSNSVYKLNFLSDYIKSLEDWELVEYVSRYSVTRKWLLTDASHVTKQEVEKVWETRYPGEPIPILGCVPPLHSESSVNDYLKSIEVDVSIRSE